MHQPESSEKWATEDAAAGKAATMTFGEEALPGQATPQDQVLARIPDLDPAEPGPDADADAEPARSDGRVISQGLSTKLLVGGGILLVAIAVTPWLLNRKPDPEGGKPPAPWAEEAPIFDAEAAQITNGQSQSPTTPYQPPMSFDPEIPAGPDFTNPAEQGASRQTLPWGGQNQLNAPGGHAQTPDWNYQSNRGTLDRQGQVPQVTVRPPKTAWDSRGSSPTWSNRSQPPSISNSPDPLRLPAAKGSPMPDAHSPAGTYDGRFEARQPSPGYYRNYRQPRSDADRPRAHSNQSMMINDRTSTVPGGYWGDYRRDERADSGTDPRTVYPPHSVEPGVARLEGIIAKPPVRTTYDRARSSLY